MELIKCKTADDPNRVVTVAAQSGKSGAEVSISYTNCKVVGNGSFGVVFAAKMLGKFALKSTRNARDIWLIAETRKQRGKWSRRTGVRDCYQEGVTG